MGTQVMSQTQTWLRQVGIRFFTMLGCVGRLCWEVCHSGVGFRCMMFKPLSYRMFQKHIPSYAIFRGTCATVYPLLSRDLSPLPSLRTVLKMLYHQMAKQYVIVSFIKGLPCYTGQCTEFTLLHILLHSARVDMYTSKQPPVGMPLTQLAPYHLADSNEIQ